MSKPCLRLVHSSNGDQLQAVRRQRDRDSRPLLIQVAARAKSAPSESFLEAALKLINLGLLTSYHNYVVFLQASIAVLEACNRNDPEKTR
jgi:hypothetical protein